MAEIVYWAVAAVVGIALVIGATRWIWLLRDELRRTRQWRDFYRELADKRLTELRKCLDKQMVASIHARADRLRKVPREKP